MGFAEGFRSGFGLISDVKDRELQRDRLEEQARQGDLDREATSAYRAEQNRLAGDRNAIAQTEADSQAAYREGQITGQAETNRIRALEAENMLWQDIMTLNLPLLIKRPPQKRSASRA